MKDITPASNARIAVLMNRIPSRKALAGLLILSLFMFDMALMGRAPSTLGAPGFSDLLSRAARLAVQPILPSFKPQTLNLEP